MRISKKKIVCFNIKCSGGNYELQSVYVYTFYFVIFSVFIINVLFIEDNEPEYDLLHQLLFNHAMYIVNVSSRFLKFSALHHIVLSHKT